ncbi:hypothetical protein K457DRAFT_650423 [Linnemannia elongata AG-77]|uniref:Uncharacterized protein n=1 Tax=Linnemannia elongata AG-77 TaxID=1314771 RepID=A0A197KD96_9FUNG|nr:hypothetical protein K457DRAFT_650423 [Linnemannia elongata AG-77]
MWIVWICGWRAKGRIISSFVYVDACALVAPSLLKNQPRRRTQSTVVVVVKLSARDEAG